MPIKNTDKLIKLARIIRESILQMNYAAGSGHPGGALSSADIVTALYFDEMNIDPKKPDWSERDRFILSKGHSCMVLYAALAEKGYFSKEHFKQLRHVNAMLQGHPDMIKTPGVDSPSGSLSQGFSVGCGIALGAKRLKKQFRINVLLGDGELNEGQVWEALAFAAHYKLDNLMAIVDNNGLQSDARNEDILNMQPLSDKFIAFGWHVIEINGHDFNEILSAFSEAKRIKNKPSIIIAHTIKGKGVSYMENVPKWHGSCAPCESDYIKAIKEINEG
jgi:transketolase